MTEYNKKMGAHIPAASYKVSIELSFQLFSTNNGEIDPLKFRKYDN